MRKFNVISGLPRSGSTLLCNLLNMNPKFHSTSTSYTIDILNNMRSAFSHNPTAKSHDRLSEIQSMRDGMRGFLEGYYSDKEVVFDKSRGWIAKLPILDDIFGHKDTKVIWTYRDPLEVVSSVEKRYQETLLLENPDEGNGANYTFFDNRINTLINDGGIVANPVWLLDNAFKEGYGDRILLVRYWDLTNRTQETLNIIHDFIGEERYQYDKEDFADLKQSTYEFDGTYNYKFMHTIKEGGVKYKKHEIDLPYDHIMNINTRFFWLNQMAFNGKENIPMHQRPPEDIFNQA
jgi:sulfotransferase